MQPVTVAIADADRSRRAGYERFLQHELGVVLITNETSNNEVRNDHALINRRLKSRADISEQEDEVARVKRLKPNILLVNLNLCTDDDHALLLSLRHECPETRIILLVNDSVDENQFIPALEIGARGYLKYEAVQHYLSRAIQVVERGEAWVPRKMLGDIMKNVLH